MPRGYCGPQAVRASWKRLWRRKRWSSGWSEVSMWIQVIGFLHGFSDSDDGISAMLNDVFGILIQGLSGLGRVWSPVEEDEELEAQAFFQQIYLLYHHRREIVPLFGGLCPIWAGSHDRLTVPTAFSDSYA